MEDLNKLNENITNIIYANVEKVEMVFAQTHMKSLRELLEEMKPIVQQLKHGKRDLYYEYIEILNNRLNNFNKKVEPNRSLFKELEDKENVNVDDAVEEEPKVGRPRRKAFNKASENIKIVTTEPLNSKLRRPTIVKKEKNDEIDDNQMPPPKDPPQKRGRKKKEVVIKAEKPSNRQTDKINIIEETVPARKSERSSDVVLISQVNTVINLMSDDEDNELPVVGKVVPDVDDLNDVESEAEPEKIFSAPEEGVEPLKKTNRTKNKKYSTISTVDDDEVIEAGPKKRGRTKKKTIVNKAPILDIDPNMDEDEELQRKAKIPKKVATKKVSEYEEMEEEKTEKELKRLTKRSKSNERKSRDKIENSEGAKSPRKNSSVSNWICEDVPTVSEQPSLYEDAEGELVDKCDDLPVPSKISLMTGVNETRIVETRLQSVNETRVIETPLQSVNETRIIEAPLQSVNETRIIEAPLQSVNETVVIERNGTEVSTNYMLSSEKPIFHNTIMNNTNNDSIDSLFPKNKKATLMQLDKTKVIANETVVINAVNETRIIEMPVLQNMNQESVQPSKYNDEDDQFALNGTKIITPAINETVVIDKTNAKPSLQSVEPKTVKSKKKPEKEIFSPYENSPVKKRVEAFENYAKSTSKLKKRFHSDVEKMTSKMTTPTNNRVLPSMSKGYDPGSASKTLSAMKASKQEFREREMHRREKEMEAAKKKEAMLLAMTEEKKRKREEKENKAKLHREELEREKQRVYEAQKVKEEKQKLAASEKHEKLQKLREENEKKRLLLKQKQEKKKLDEQKQRQKVPIYMTMKAPLLPTFDCYDSDSDQEERDHPTIEKPEWLKAEHMRLANRIAAFVNGKLQNTLFSLKPKTPDLSKIFQNIEPDRLRRNSSAIWKHPPRFTLLPHAEEENDV
ncbi:PREDICTED: uncharacterized protein PFB0765w-like [Nicrophorus vespilloides]|uniref:Uncharacterized protein PFB0765w-like n=1 Tax=Nicrophorus vespilloides TaxID=110193 RepID=A0ABM1MJ64_NICVS|nr:PREDICTED: uncharacterized protein PFB0765w-like [Nicrophorus vespilloides]